MLHVPYNEMMDTNGCGDAFVGGFLSRLVDAADDDRETIETCVAEGHRCAGLICGSVGAVLVATQPHPRAPLALAAACSAEAPDK